MRAPPGLRRDDDPACTRVDLRQDVVEQGERLLAGGGTRLALAGRPIPRQPGIIEEQGDVHRSGSPAQADPDHEVVILNPIVLGSEGRTIPRHCFEQIAADQREIADVILANHGEEIEFRFADERGDPASVRINAALVGVRRGCRRVISLRWRANDARGHRRVGQWRCRGRRRRTPRSPHRGQPVATAGPAAPVQTQQPDTRLAGRPSPDTEASGYGSPCRHRRVMSSQERDRTGSASRDDQLMDPSGGCASARVAGQMRSSVAWVVRRIADASVPGALQLQRGRLAGPVRVTRGKILR